LYIFSRILTLLFDGLLLPFGTHRLAGLLVVSALSGAALALLFRATSDQARIRRARDVFKARVLEMRLYPDDFVLISRALFGALASQLTYLRIALKPILVVLVVAIPMFLQLEARFAPAPLLPGNRALVTATLKEGLDANAIPAALTGDGGIQVDPLPVRVPATREIVWRTSLAEAGDAPLTLTVYDRPYRFDVSGKPGTSVIGRNRAAHGFLDPLLHPGLPSIPADSPVAALRIGYPDDSYHLFGRRMSWLVVFLIGSFVGALLPAWFLRIQL
jgi:predicted small integral membrane protein